MEIMNLIIIGLRILLGIAVFIFGRRYEAHRIHKDLRHKKTTTIIYGNNNYSTIHGSCVDYLKH